jgi:UDPglucose 6-dehydrogenase
MKISVIGTGYVGLVTGTCFAETGNTVICMDVDSNKISKLKKGISPIYEPGLDSLLEKNIKSKRLVFTTSLSDAVDNSELIFLCLPTPPGADGSADTRYVMDVADKIGKIANSGSSDKIVVTKSTVPIGTADKLKELFRKYPNVDIRVASNPEFLKEGNAIQDFMFPDRVVIGVEDAKAEKILRELYEPFVRTGAPILVMETRSAEMVKYAANAFLATRVSFINEIAQLCEQLGADVDKVRIAIGYDNRIGQKFLFPGIGWGGSCFPKDVRALINIGREVNAEPQILSAVNNVNERQKGLLYEKIKKHYGADLNGRKFAVWGLSFKPKTDDMREAPSITVIEALLKSGAAVSAFDPVAMDNARAIFGKRISFGKDQYALLKESDALVLVTEWQEFREPDFQRMKSLMRSPVIFDGRNIYNPEKVRSLGFVYYGIGRK